jgi:hypothetical protein
MANLHEVLQDRPDKIISVEDAIIDLLGCYGLGNKSEAVTQGNLKILHIKTKTCWPAVPASRALTSSTGCGVSASPRRRAPLGRAGTRGDARHRHDAVENENALRSILDGDSDAVISALLHTNYSSARCISADKTAPTTIPVLSHAAAVASAFPTYEAKCVLDSDVCAARPHDDIVLSDALARSLLDCTVFMSMQTLCKPLAALGCRPYDEFERLSMEGGSPSHEAVVHAPSARRPLHGPGLHALLGVLREPAVHARAQ